MKESIFEWRTANDWSKVDVGGVSVLRSRQSHDDDDDGTNSFKSTTRVYNKIIQSVSFYFALLLILLPSSYISAAYSPPSYALSTAPSWDRNGGGK